MPEGSPTARATTPGLFRSLHRHAVLLYHPCRSIVSLAV